MLRLCASGLCRGSTFRTGSKRQPSTQPIRRFFWQSESTEKDNSPVGADRHTVERFTPTDPRRRKRDLPETPPLTHAFPGVPEVDLKAATAQQKTLISTLRNGVRVASEENFSQMSVVGLFVNTGTRFEDPSTYGASYLLERMSFKTSEKTSMQDIVSELENMGSHVTTSSSREVMVYSAEILRHHVERSMELIAETTQHPQFVPEELEDQLKAYSYDYEENSTNPDTMLPEMLHQIAFPAHPMGRTLLLPPEQLQKITPDVLRDYMKRRYVGSNMVVCGAGVDHNLLVKLAETYFGHLPANSNISSNIALERPNYAGGEMRIPIPEDKMEKHDKSCAMIGFEAGGFDDPDFYILYTLNSMMGGGSSFSSGGPGKGMYTRLYTRVLNRYGWIDVAETYISSYKDTGLFGLYAKCDHDRLSDLVKVICGELVDVARRVQSDELERAKNQLKTSIFMNLESRAILFDDIGRQVLLYNRRYTARELCDLIDSVTVEDVKRVVRRLLAVPPSIVYYGLPDQLERVPSYEKVSKLLSAAR